MDQSNQQQIIQSQPVILNQSNQFQQDSNKSEQESSKSAQEVKKQEELNDRESTNSSDKEKEKKCELNAENGDIVKDNEINSKPKQKFLSKSRSKQLSSRKSSDQESNSKSKSKSKSKPKKKSKSNNKKHSKSHKVDHHSKHKSKSKSKSRNKSHHKHEHSQKHHEHQPRRSHRSHHHKSRSRTPSKSSSSRSLSSASRDNKRTFLRHYKTQMKNISERNKELQENKQGTLFWDGFQWVPKQLDGTVNKDLRTLLITGLPKDTNFNEQQLVEFLNVYMQQNYIANSSNKQPVLGCVLNLEAGSARIECSSLEEANRFAKIGKMTIMKQECKVGKYIDTNQYNVNTQIEQAQRAALAQAATYKALTMLSSANASANEVTLNNLKKLI